MLSQVYLKQLTLDPAIEPKVEIFQNTTNSSFSLWSPCIFYLDVYINFPFRHLALLICIFYHVLENHTYQHLFTFRKPFESFQKNGGKCLAKIKHVRIQRNNLFQEISALSSLRIRKCSRFLVFFFILA